MENKDIERVIEISESIDQAIGFKEDVEEKVWQELEMIYNTKNFDEETKEMVRDIIQLTIVSLARIDLDRGKTHQ